MENSGREYLTGAVMLSRSEDGSFPDEYSVISVLGEGGSAVCYKAKRRLKDGTVETGRLKEFYPIDSAGGGSSWYFSLKRLEDGRLVPLAGTVRRFDEMCRNYTGSYKLLKKAVSENPENEILNNYIQDGEILYSGAAAEEGSAEDRQAQKGRKISSSVYIWTKGVAGIGFDVYLAEVRKNPGRKPEEKLRSILGVTDTLADCIKALHDASLMHMDIKPSNFLVQYKSNLKINLSSISLFDINTMCPIEEGFKRKSGTPGFCAPEVKKGGADNRSDIYSIGAMLFNALVISDEIPDGLYRDSYYAGIDRFIKDSALFKASEINSDALLMSGICRILKKCLAENPKNRYWDCEQLKNDLEKAIKRLETVSYGPASKSKAADPVIVMQRLLNDHPLYEGADENINVLVLGAGSYGQKFIDVCLQTGQMYEKELGITAVCAEPEEDKEAYLRFRPALCEFVNIDGSYTGPPGGAYAGLDFKGISDAADGKGRPLRFGKDRRTDTALVKALFGEAERKGRGYNYVFTALGDDDINADIAGLCAQEAKRRRGRACCVAFVTFKKPGRAKAQPGPEGIYPVFVNEPADIGKIDRRLTDMAFNTHLSWKGPENTDPEKEREKFFKGHSEEDRYNRRSSIAYALSVKYKLASVGIESDDPLKAAVRFSEEILEKKETDEAARRKFDTIVDLEHRRWVLERAADGWRAPRDKNGRLKLEECVIRGSVKDVAARLHPCMVHGSAASPLSSPPYAEGDLSGWDSAENDPELDELDSMSVELHRCFKRHADAFRKENGLLSPDLKAIESLIPSGAADVRRAFSRFKFALKNILDGNAAYSRQYGSCEEAFAEAVCVLPAEDRIKIKERLAVIRHAFFPVVESNLYRDYKSYDAILIEKIPFILTFRPLPAVAMAFEDGKHCSGSGDALFSDVASATVLYPRKLYYLYCCGRDLRPEELSEKLAAVMDYLGRRNIRCAVELFICCLAEVADKERDELQKEISGLKEKYSGAGAGTGKEASPGADVTGKSPDSEGKNYRTGPWIEKETVCDAADSAQAVSMAARFLKSRSIDLYDGSSSLFSSMHDNMVYSLKLEELGIPYFEFDRCGKKFTRRKNCEYLRFIKDDSFIRVRDMFALTGAEDIKFNYPEYEQDYEKLWKIYTGNFPGGPNAEFRNGVRNWNRLCRILGEYDEDRGMLAQTELSEEEEEFDEMVRFFLPAYSFSAVKKLLEGLVGHGICAKDSSLSGYAEDTCLLELITCGKYKKHLECAFSRPQVLLEYYRPHICTASRGGREYIAIMYNDLEVKDVCLDKYDTSARTTLFSCNILRQLEREGYIRQLEISEGLSRASFCYTSPRIKEMLTSAGKILEIYTYYEALKTGCFDDAACGFEFSWKKGGVENELDLVFTKGFRSMIVECKAVAELEQDYYHKLGSIAGRFGVGTISVMVGNTYMDDRPSFGSINEKQRSRGRQLDIITVSGEEKITDIGRTLAELMK